MQKESDEPIGKIAFESTLEIKTKEEMDNLYKACLDSIEGKNIPEYSPEEIEAYLIKCRNNFRKRHGVKSNGKQKK